MQRRPFTTQPRSRSPPPGTAQRPLPHSLTRALDRAPSGWRPMPHAAALSTTTRRSFVQRPAAQGAAAGVERWEPTARASPCVLQDHRGSVEQLVA